MCWCGSRRTCGAAERLRQVNPWRHQRVTYIELAQGCRNKAELERLKEGTGAARDTDHRDHAAISERANAAHRSVHLECFGSVGRCSHRRYRTEHACAPHRQQQALHAIAELTVESSLSCRRDPKQISY